METNKKRKNEIIIIYMQKQNILEAETEPQK